MPVITLPPLIPIDPITNPAQPNWLSYYIADQILSDYTLYAQLTQADFNQIAIIDLPNQSIEEIPFQLANVTYLTQLRLPHNQIINIAPIAFAYLDNIKVIDLSHNQIRAVPDSILSRTTLETLDLSFNQIIEIRCRGIIDQSIVAQDIVTLTDQPCIINLPHLTTLSLENNFLTLLPPDIIHLPSLTNLNLNMNLLNNQPNQDQLLLIDTSSITLRLGWPLELYLLEDKVTLQSGRIIPSDFMYSTIIDNPSLFDGITAVSPGSAIAYIRISFGLPIDPPSPTVTPTGIPITVLPIPQLIDPATYPAEDNWLSRYIAQELYGDELYYPQLTQADFDQMRTILVERKYLYHIPKQIENVRFMYALYLPENHIDAIAPELENLWYLSNLDLSVNQIRGLPTEFTNIPNLRELRLSGNPLQGLPMDLGKLSSLFILAISNCTLTTLPLHIGDLTHLTLLYADRNQLLSLPPSIINLTNLEELYLDNNELQDLPTEIGNLSKLTDLKLQQNALTSIPYTIGKMINLTSLGLSYNKLVDLPDEIGNLTKLYSFDVSHNQLRRIPQSISHLTNMSEVLLDYNQLPELPDTIWSLPQMTFLSCEENLISHISPRINQASLLSGLNLAHNQITILPDEIGELITLTMLTINNNQLTALPQTLGQLTALTILDVSSNKLTDLPSSISNLSNLRQLALSDNIIESLPPDFGNFPRLAIFRLDHNHLSTLPAPLENAIELRELSLSANTFISLPTVIPKLINMTNLDLSYNQFVADPPPLFDMLVPFTDFEDDLPPDPGETNLISYDLSYNLIAPPDEVTWDQLILTNKDTLSLSIGDTFNLDLLKSKVGLDSGLLVSQAQSYTLSLPDDSYFDAQWTAIKTGTVAAHIKVLGASSTNFAAYTSDTFLIQILPAGIQPIDPVSNPAQDNWLSRYIASVTLGNATLFPSLTQENFNQITRINLPNAFITSLPEQLLNVLLLEELFLPYNLLSTLPSFIYQLEHLTTLSLAYNQLTYFPSLLTSTLAAANTDLPAVQTTPSRLPLLTTLDLSYNQLVTLPDDLLYMPSLKTVNLISNQLVLLPSFSPTIQLLLDNNLLEATPNQDQLLLLDPKTLNLLVGETLNLDPLKDKVRLQSNRILAPDHQYVLMAEDAALFDTNWIALAPGSTTIKIRIAGTTPTNTAATTLNNYTVTIEQPLTTIECTCNASIERDCSFQNLCWDGPINILPVSRKLTFKHIIQRGTILYFDGTITLTLRADACNCYNRCKCCTDFNSITIKAPCAGRGTLPSSDPVTLDQLESYKFTEVSSCIQLYYCGNAFHLLEHYTLLLTFVA